MTQLMIYRSAVPVNRNTHQDCFVEVGPNYGFTSEVNSVPLTAIEFPYGAGEYPIVFSGTDTEITPVAMLGVRNDENLFLGPDGTWQARYIPAFVRRYPFVFSHSESQFVLCIDEEFPGFNREGRGQPLFNADGATSSYVDGILHFLQDYQANFNATRQFCDRLLKLDLLEAMTAQINVEGGTPLTLAGFMAVSRDKLKALPAETIAELAKSDELELIYLHLQSLRNFDLLRERLGQHAEPHTIN